MARHRHVVCVRDDGLSAVLRPLLDHRWIAAATLVDAASGFVLDGYATGRDDVDVERLGTGHAELARGAAAIDGVGGPSGEVTVATGDGRRHLLQPLADPHGDHLVLVVVVEGGALRARRVRRRLRTVSPDAVTAGPSLRRRPVDGVWSSTPSLADPAATPDPPTDRQVPGRGTADREHRAATSENSPEPLPPAAMIPRADPPEHPDRPAARGPTVRDGRRRGL
ncbi:hypothetical protein ACR9E3_22435 [Actinomycetospora sp. C-140]